MHYRWFQSDEVQLKVLFENLELISDRVEIEKFSNLKKIALCFILSFNCTYIHYIINVLKRNKI